MQTQHKVLLALVLIVGAAIWAISGSSETDPYLDVHTVAAGPAEADRTLSVKGEVVANTTTIEDGTVRFLLQDASGKAVHNGTMIPVVYDGVLPDAFGPKMIVATGTLVSTDAGVVLQATEIQVGCSSKY